MEMLKIVDQGRLRKKIYNSSYNGTKYPLVGSGIRR